MAASGPDKAASFVAPFMGRLVVFERRKPSFPHLLF